VKEEGKGMPILSEGLHERDYFGTKEDLGEEGRGKKARLM